MYRWLRRAFAAIFGLGVVLAAPTGGPRAEPRSVGSTLIPQSASPEIGEAISRLAADVRRWGGTLGLAVVDTETGALLAALNEHQPLNPASNAKLVTATAALRSLGAQHRFLTGLYGSVEGDSLDELVLRGDGDPSLSTADLFRLAMDLRALGLRRVGTIVVDQSFFDDQYVPRAFDQQPNEWAPFRAPVSPVALNENTVLFTIRSTRATAGALVDVDPPGFVDVNHDVVTVSPDSPEHLTITLEPNGMRLRGHATGHVPEGSRMIRIARRVADPRLLPGYGLRAVLKQLGIETGPDLQLGASRRGRILASHRSASLGELLSALGKDSDNFYAEMVFKAIGVQAAGRPASSDRAADASLDVLRQLGAMEPGVEIRNGSGLFDANRLTAASVVTLLRTVRRDPLIGPEFVAHLAVGGVDGTLHHRFRDWAPVRAIRAKTGTLNAVAALSGYVLGPPGRAPVAFSILLNGIPGKTEAARGAMDRVVDAVARQVWRGVPVL